MRLLRIQHWYRSILELWRREVGARIRAGFAATARLRGPRPGTLQRPTRAFFTALCPSQYAGLQPDYAGQYFPRLATPDEAGLPQTADHHVAQVPTAPP